MLHIHREVEIHLPLMCKLMMYVYIIHVHVCMPPFFFNQDTSHFLAAYAFTIGNCRCVHDKYSVAEPLFVETLQAIPRVPSAYMYVFQASMGVLLTLS